MASNQLVCQEEVVHHLIELFGNSLHFDIIKSVAQNCNYDLEKTTDVLLEFTHNMQSANHNKYKPNLTRQKKSKKEMEIERTIDLIRTGYKIVVLIRGLPGSGKSSMARRIVELSVDSQNYQDFIYSADDFFIRNGMYCYDPTKIAEAHNVTQQKALTAMKVGLSPIIIDNTNTQMWEMKPYVMMAVEYGYLVEILEPPTPWAFDEKELARRNTHGVPRNKIKDMLLRFERNVTVEKIFSAYNLRYERTRPPLMRNYPALGGGKVVEDKREKTQMSQSLNGFVTGKIIPHVNSFHNDGIDGANSVRSNGDETGNTGTEWSSSHEQEATTKKILMDDESEDPTPSIKPEPLSQQNDILNAWGLTERALRSWDICTPLEDPASSATPSTEPEHRSPTPTPMTCDASTETTAYDFFCADNPEGGILAVLPAKCREISGPDVRPMMAPRKKIMCDKSSSTSENVFIAVDRKEQLELLRMVFPDIPASHLRDVYEKCRGDVNWAVDLLAEDNKWSEGLDLRDEEEVYVSDVEEDVRVKEKDTVEVEEAAGIAEEIPKKMTKNKEVSPESAELKTAFEKLIDINQDYYSEHVLKIKKIRHPTYADTAGPLKPTEETAVTSSMSAKSSSDMETDGSDSDTSEEFIELNLGETFVTELENKLPDQVMLYPKGFMPIVQLPISMARRLFALYIESVHQQMEAEKAVLETMVKEDEVFAKKLQEQEEEKQRVATASSRPPVSLSEIMDEQLADSLYRKDVDEWKKLTPDDLAARLTKQKLFESFPHLDRNQLLEIWQATGNNYRETVECIIASSPDTIAIEGEILEPPISENVVDEMKSAQANVRELNSRLEQSTSAASYREEAATYQTKRTELYRKAQTYYQRGMGEVAHFYSQLAIEQTRLFDRANNLAASAFLNEHSKRISNYDTIDLHYLQVKEALTALDIFIDNSVYLLKGKLKPKNLFVITGRGNNSPGGISRIKPAVKGRLRARNIKYRELNPGLLEICVNKSTVITSDLP